MQSFDINIPINSTRNIDAQGDYLSYYSGSAGGADTTLLLSHDSSGSTIQLKPGQAIRLQKGRSGGLWRLSNYANQGTIIGSVVIGSGQIDDHTITGTVQTIDGELNRSKAGVAYTGYANVTAVAAQSAFLEMWNPENSGVRCIVTDLLFSSNAACTYVLKRTTANVYANVGAISKLSTAGVSLTKVGGSTIGVLPGTGLELCLCSANSPLLRAFKQPYICMPGSGVIVSATDLNVSVYAAAQFTEEVI